MTTTETTEAPATETATEEAEAEFRAACAAYFAKATASAPDA